VTNFTNTSNQTNIYYSGLLTSRYYVNNHADYFATILGYGTIPDDFSRVYQFTNINNYNTVSVGAGYSKQFHYRTTLSIFGTWYNEKVALNQITGAPEFINQYDIYVTLLRRF
jgi:hypothetical protein